MIKKIKYILILFICALSLCALCSCSNDEKAKQLASPTNIKIIDDLLVWDEVDQASGYVVAIDGEENNVETNSFTLPTFKESATIDITIKATGDNLDFCDSEWTKYLYDYEKPTEALAYTLLDDGSGYKVKRLYKDVNKGLEGRVVIPEFYNGLPVKEIADNAFSLVSLFNIQENTVTTSFKLPKSIISIGIEAFENCKILDEINIPDGVTEIPEFCFFGCPKLKTVILSNNIIKIGESAFGCSGITEMQIPNSVKTIETAAFDDCLELVSITLPDGVTELSGTFFHCRSLSNIIIPTSVEILDGTFNGCTSLTEIEVPENVKEIGDRAFYGCTNLAKITYPTDLQALGKETLTNTAWYDSQPEGYVTIGKYLIGYKGDVPQEINSDDFSATAIAGYVFYNNNNIVSINLPNVQLLGECIFSSCQMLEDVQLPNASIIPNYTFYNCSNLKSIIISNVEKLGTNAFSRCYDLEKVILGDKVKSISTYAFSSKKLESIVMPTSIVTLEESAFKSCILLKSIYYAGTKEQWQNVNIVDTAPGKSNDVSSLDIYFYSETEPTFDDEAESNYWHYVDGIPTVWTKDEQ